MPTTTATAPRSRGDEPNLHLRPAGARQLELPEIAEEHSLDRSHEAQAIDTIRLRYKGVTVRVSGLPSSRTVSAQQKRSAAELFGAEPSSVSMSTLLWNAKEPAVKSLRQVFHEISRAFHNREWTLPSNRDGLRLIRRDALPQFHQRLLGLETQLAAAAAALEAELPQIVAREQVRRGKMFQPGDYTFRPTQLCSVEWSFPAVVEDRELAEIDESVYHAEIARVRQDLEDCVRLTETRMAEDLYTALRQAAARLSGGAAGDKLTFRSTTVTKLFDELTHISSQLADNGIGGAGFGAVATQLQGLLHGQSPENLPDALRRDGAFRQSFSQSCTEIAETLLATAVPAAGRRVLWDKVEKRLAE